MAWTEGGSRKHEIDIMEMLIFHYGLAGHASGPGLDEIYVDKRVAALGQRAVALWSAAKTTAKNEIERRASR